MLFLGGIVTFIGPYGLFQGCIILCKVDLNWTFSVIYFIFVSIRHGFCVWKFWFLYNWTFRVIRHSRVGDRDGLNWSISLSFLILSLFVIELASFIFELKTGFEVKETKHMAIDKENGGYVAPFLNFDFFSLFEPSKSRYSVIPRFSTLLISKAISLFGTVLLLTLF